MCILCESSDLDQSTIFLDCSNCDKITTLPEYLPNLKFLVIYGTNISTIPSYKSLEGLYCMGCPINSLPDLPKLTKLNASGSSLKSLPNSLYRLETILVDDTNVSDIPDTLISSITISANNTKVSNVSEKLINVESLSIANTQVSEINVMMSLQYLNCSGTSVSSILVDKMPMLRKIYAKECSISDPFSIIERGIDLFN